MNAEKSNVIQQKFKLGVRPYTDLRQFLLPYVEIAPAYKTKIFREQHEPEIKPCHMDGVWAPLRGISYQIISSVFFKRSHKQCSAAWHNEAKISEVRLKTYI